MKKSLIFFITFFFEVFLIQIFGQTTWTEVTPAGDFAMDWRATAINSNGSKMIAGVSSGRLYISTDGGNSWNETQPNGDVDQYWDPASMSSDGSFIMAGADGGRLFKSSNSGGDWTEVVVQPVGNNNKNWRTISMSTDGTNIIAGASSGRLYISANSGDWWDETRPAGDVNQNWYSTSMSGDGSIIIASAYSGRIYISTNSGAVWTETNPTGIEENKTWRTTSMSSDGTTMIAGIFGGRLFKSNNTGGSWTEVRPAGDFDISWMTTSMSADGNYILAGEYNGKMYISGDGGSSWSESTLPLWGWRTSSISADGSKAIVGGSVGRLYINTSPLPVELTSFTGELIENNTVLLEWETATEVNNYGFQVQRTMEKVQSEEEWEEIGFVQGHGTTNSPKSYSFIDPLNLDLNHNLTRLDYRLKQIDLDGTFTYSKIVTVDLTTITSVDDEVVYQFSLEQNYPNPFNPSTTIKFTVPSNVKSETSNTKLVVYDILGREVATLLNQKLQPGNHEVTFNGSSLSSGIYFYKIQTSSGFVSTKKLMLLK